MNNGGRPRKWNSAEELQQDIDNYFIQCDEQERPYTITGLCLLLDCDRKTLLNYSDKEEFFHTIKRAKQKIENYAEEQLYRNGNVTGIIFNLKNNYEWKDKSETELSGSLATTLLKDDISE